MKFKEEINKISSNLLPFNLSLSDGGGYFIGVKKILTVNSQEISLKLSSRVITVFGENLKICKLIDGDLAFTGKIIKLECQDI